MDESTGFEAPAFLMAADVHNTLANPEGESTSLFEDVSNMVTQGLPAVAIATYNELANIPANIGNLFMSEENKFETVTNRERIAEFDSNLLNYYDAHQTGIDVAGFVASSLVPGIGSTKVLKIGQLALRDAVATGNMGRMTSAALGLVAPQREKYLAQAISQIGKTGNPFDLFEANTIKTLIAGAHEQFIEGAVFTAAVNATMYNSPVMDGRDAGDLAWDVVTGGVLGGAIGGGLLGITAKSSIKRGAETALKELEPWTHIEIPREGTIASDRILFKLRQIEEIPAIPADFQYYERAGKEAVSKTNALWKSIREDVSSITGDDTNLTNMLMHHMQDGKRTFNDNMNMLLEARSISRVTKTSEIEKQLNKTFKEIQNNPLAVTPEQQEIFNKYAVAFVNNHTGEMMADRPAMLTLPDRLKPGESITLSRDGRTINVGGYKSFTNENNPSRPFNILGLSAEQVDARYYWAEMTPALDKNIVHKIHANDIPMLQKAMRDGVENISIIPESGVIADARTVSGAGNIAEYTRAKQLELAGRLRNAEVMPQSVEELVSKLKHHLGINFNTVDEIEGANGWFTRIKQSLNSGNEILGDVINLESIGLKGRSLSKIVQTLKHEEGHMMFQSLLDAKGVTRQNLDTLWAGLAGEVEDMSRKVRPNIWKSKNPEMITYREDWHEQFADAFSYLSKNPERMKAYPEFEKFAGHLVKPIPQEVLDAVSRRVTKPTEEEISRILNAHEDVLAQRIDNPEAWNARDLARAEAKKSGMTTDPMHQPKYSKIIVQKDRIQADGHLVEGMAIVDQRQKLFQQAANRIAVEGLQEELGSTAGMRHATIGTVAGPGMVTSENGGYGSFSSFFSYVGQRTHNIIGKWKEATSDILNPNLYKLAGDTEAAVEWSMLHETMRGLPSGYHLADDGASLVYGSPIIAADFTSEAAYSKALAARAAKIEELENLGIPATVPLESPLVQRLVADHIELNNKRRGLISKIHNNNGYPDKFDTGVFYPIPRDPKDTPFFAFVVDEHVTGTGHSQMIYAKDAATLEQMRNEILTDPKLRDSGITVLTRGESEEYYRSIGKYDFERTLSDNYINTALRRSGKSKSFLPLTDPNRIATNTLDWHHARDAATVRSLVEHKYAGDFARFRAMADTSVSASTSRFGRVANAAAYAETAVNTPATNLIKMALDISKADEYPLWTPMNKFLDKAFSGMVDKIGVLFSKATDPSHLDEVNTALRKYGYEGPIVEESIYRAMNGKIARNTLSNVVGKANAILAGFALRADPFNALNNAVGATVLLGPETKSLLKHIQSLAPDAMKEFEDMATVAAPGTGDRTMSASKMIAKRMKDFHADKEGNKWFREHGFISTISEQYDQVLDNLAVALSRGEESFANKALVGFKKLGDTAEKWTGNKLAEEFNRYVAAGVAKDITDIAVKRGLMDADLQLSYVNTFVNRTQGNYIAAQRPAIFHGPVGQAIGLFQTYQFNLLQQVFRYVGDGELKNVALMAGLQTGIFGMNGLPAFNAINTYIIGDAGGNTQHRNLYDAVMSGAGKEAGEWLLYGGLSNGLGLFHPDLKINLYTRGDINSRNITLVPTDPTKIPIYQATARLFSNIKEGYSKIQAGGDVWSTFLRGVEQNGISRPLAGMAQVLEAAGRDDKKVISTNAQGNMLMAHDLYSLSSLMRIMGAKPLDEAVVNDTMFRMNVYRTADVAKRKVLGEAVKNTILSNGTLTEEQVAEFASSYAKSGGKMKEFGSWIANQYKNVSISKAEQMRRAIGGPKSTMLQILMNDGDGFSTETN